MARCPARPLALLCALTALGACGDPPAEEGFEYIVVGSGAGGGPLASRLARAGHRVLLLEAGEDVGGKLEYQVPAMHAISTEDEDMAWWFWVEHHAEEGLDQQDSKYTPEGILYPRGSALGGSTAVNAMVTILPSRSDWDRLAELTDDGRWRASKMDAYYERVREWLPVEMADPELASDDAKIVDFLMAAVAEVTGEDIDEGLLEAGGAEAAIALAALLGGDLNEAYLAGEPEGVYRLPSAVEDGERRGTREFILDTVEQGYPLTVATGSFVTRVLWDDDAQTPTAVGVEFVQGRGVYQASLGDGEEPSAAQQAYASREVILSAGVFNSPQLLMLSGVGDPEHLAEVGIEPVVSLPGVGRNLQDRYEAAVVAQLDEPLSSIEDCETGADVEDDPCLQDWMEGEGIYNTNGFAATALVRSSPDQPLSDLQIFAFPADARGYYPGYSADATAVKDHFSWLILKGHTDNDDGRVTLTGADPLARPKIVFNSYQESDPYADPDLLAMVEGVKRVRAITERARERDPSGTIEEIWPGPEVDGDREIADFVRRESWGHHACCTNPMGADGDPDAVLDSELRVRGAQGLRVVDASVFPEIPGTFIALPIFMVSEAAADAILEDVQ